MSLFSLVTASLNSDDERHMTFQPVMFVTILQEKVVLYWKKTLVSCVNVPCNHEVCPHECLKSLDHIYNLFVYIQIVLCHLSSTNVRSTDTVECMLKRYIYKKTLFFIRPSHTLHHADNYLFGIFFFFVPFGAKTS